MGEWVIDVLRDRLEGYSLSFIRMAQVFAGLPDKKDRMEAEDMGEITREIRDTVCATCERRAYCWKKYSRETRSRFDRILSGMEEGEPGLSDGGAAMGFCCHRQKLYQAMLGGYQNVKNRILWQNRMLESRKAVARQLYETGNLMRSAAKAIYNIKAMNELLFRELEVKLRINGITLGGIWCQEGENGCHKYYASMKVSKKSRCVSVKEAAGVFSQIMEDPVVPDKEGRIIIGREFATYLFVSRPRYHMLTGAAKLTREGEMVSGDSYTCFSTASGRMIMSLSDGMGSGVEACRESERVIELLEQFLYAGISQETALQMIHSLVSMEGSEFFSTVDLAVVDLYNGSCQLLKIGAAATFHKSAQGVAPILSTTLPLGMAPELEVDVVKRRLSQGDFLIMVTDGVLDALPGIEKEKVFSKLLENIHLNNAGEMAKEILHKVSNIGNHQIADDMTVLVGGLWE